MSLSISKLSSAAMITNHPELVNKMCAGAATADIAERLEAVGALTCYKVMSSDEVVGLIVTTKLRNLLSEGSEELVYLTTGVSHQDAMKLTGVSSAISRGEP